MSTSIWYATMVVVSLNCAAIGFLCGDRIATAACYEIIKEPRHDR